MPTRVIFIDKDGTETELDGFLLAGVKDLGDKFKFLLQANIALPDYATAMLIAKAKEMLNNYEARFITELIEQYERRYKANN